MGLDVLDPDLTPSLYELLRRVVGVALGNSSGSQGYEDRRLADLGFMDEGLGPVFQKNSRGS